MAGRIFITQKNVVIPKRFIFAIPPPSIPSFAGAFSSLAALRAALALTPNGTRANLISNLDPAITIATYRQEAIDGGAVLEGDINFSVINPLLPEIDLAEIEILYAFGASPTRAWISGGLQFNLPPSSAITARFPCLGGFRGVAWDIMSSVFVKFTGALPVVPPPTLALAYGVGWYAIEPRPTPPPPPLQRLISAGGECYYTPSSSWYRCLLSHSAATSNSPIISTSASPNYLNSPALVASIPSLRKTSYRTTIADYTDPGTIAYCAAIGDSGVANGNQVIGLANIGAWWDYGSGARMHQIIRYPALSAINNSAAATLSLTLLSLRVGG